MNMSPNPIARSTPKAPPTTVLAQGGPFTNDLFFSTHHSTPKPHRKHGRRSYHWHGAYDTGNQTTALTLAAQEAPPFRHRCRVCVESKSRRFNSSHLGPDHLTNAMQSRSRLRRRLRLLVSWKRQARWCAVCTRRTCLLCFRQMASRSHARAVRPETCAHQYHAPLLTPRWRKGTL